MMADITLPEVVVHPGDPENTMTQGGALQGAPDVASTTPAPITRPPKLPYPRQRPP